MEKKVSIIKLFQEKKYSEVIFLIDKKVPENQKNSSVLNLLGVSRILKGKPNKEDFLLAIDNFKTATLKEHKKIGKILNVTVDFIAEIITCIKDKDKKIISGDPEKVKKIYDTWVFSRDTTSIHPNWQLVNTLT